MQGNNKMLIKWLCTAYLNVMSQFRCIKLLISDWKTDVTQNLYTHATWWLCPYSVAYKHSCHTLPVYWLLVKALHTCVLWTYWVVNQGEQRKWGMCVWIYMDRKSQLSEEFPAEYLQTTISQEVNTNSIYRPRPVFSAKRGIPGLESRSSKTIYVCLIENKRRNI